MLLFIYILCSLSAFANHRTLKKDEAYAFSALYDTDDMAKLKEIEKNPQQFWNEREAALLEDGATLSHLDFCAQFVQDAKNYLKDAVPSGCTQAFEKIDNIFEALLSQDSPILPNAKADYYGTLCDEVYQSDGKYVFDLGDTMHQAIGDSILICHEVTHDLNAKLRWKMSQTGEFAIIDYLIMRRNGYFLCGAPSGRAERFAFSAHFEEFRRWKGLFEHDVLAHNLRQYSLDLYLDQRGVSSQEFFNRCCCPDDFVKGDLIAFSQKILGCFYQFHEVVSAPESLVAGKNLFSFVFPTAMCLTDAGFLKIAPYFVNVPLGYNWHEAPLTKRDGFDELKLNDYLLAWRAQHCFYGLQFLSPTQVLENFPSFLADFSGFGQLLDRDWRFIKPLLECVYKAKKTLGAPSYWSLDSFERFEDELYRFTRTFLDKLKARVQGSTRSLVNVRAPAVLLLLLRSVYFSELQDILNDSAIIFDDNADVVYVCCNLLKLEFTWNLWS